MEIYIEKKQKIKNMVRRKSVRALAKKLKRKIIRYRIKDVGRKGHHYLQIGVTKRKGKRKGRTIATLITKRELQRRIKKARKIWTRMSKTTRKGVMPNRKGKKGYKRITKYITRKGKRIRMTYWVKK